MLETLKSSVLSVCMLSTAVAICMLICPDTALEKQVKFLISLLFMISLAVPLMQLEFPESLEEMQQTQAETSALSLTQSCAEEALQLLLAQEGITCTELHVSVHIADDQSISITEVSAVCDDYQNACRVLENALEEGTALYVTEILE